MKRNILISILFFSFITLYSYGSSDVVDKLKGYVHNMETFNKYFPQEKVYLHFDNTGYFRGETIWFKAYVLRDDRSEWTDLSKVLYVELLSPMGDIMETKKLHIQDGQADGCFKLDSLFYNGFYEVRAYTRYMLNWSDNGIFRRVFPVFATPKNEGDYSHPKMIEYDYQKRIGQNRANDERTENLNVKFYPEGGKAIQGLRSRMAFEITNKNGAELDMLGVLTYPNGKTEKVSTTREGKGFFLYTPMSSPAILTFNDGKGNKKDFLLPHADTEGCVLSVNNTDSIKMLLKVSRTSSYTVSPALVLLKNGVVEAFEVLNFDNTGSAELCLDKRQMSDGINQLALIDTEGNILANRLVFVYPKDCVDSIGMTINNSFLQACKKVSIGIKSQPNTSLSVSVRDYDSEVNGSQSDVATWLLLGSDLGGYIRNVDYYLEKDDKEHRANADLLMLVQGWKRYDICQMLGKIPFEKKHPIEDGLYIYGQLYQAKKKNTVGNVTLRASLYNREGYSLSGYATTDASGHYAFKMPDCEGDWTLLLNTKKEEVDAKYHVGIDRNFSPTAKYLTYYETQQVPLSKPKQELQEVEDYGEIQAENLIREVKVKGQRKYKSARASWESEQRGAFSAFVRYDCVKAADAIVDKGGEIPTWNSWLFSQKVSFQGEEELNIENNLNESSQNNSEQDFFAFSSNGPIDPSLESMMNISRSSDTYNSLSNITYKGRPIVWIYNNQYDGLTGMSSYLGKIYQQNAVQLTNSPTGYLPTWLDELKSIYISVGNTWKSFLLFPDLEAYHPITIFIYAPYRYAVKQKGIRRTFFEGYAPKVEFYSPDYSAMTPMPDYRRTLYWNPNVTTDKNGEAKIEFYNNSTCRQLVISAEGITKDGRAIVYR